VIPFHFRSVSNATYQILNLECDRYLLLHQTVASFP
jgi:hypothetical protein